MSGPARGIPLSPARIAAFYAEVSAIRKRRIAPQSPYAGPVGLLRDMLEETQEMPRAGITKLNKAAHQDVADTNVFSVSATP